MKLKRLFGFLFIGAAAAGLIFSIIGLYEIWHYKPVVTKSVVDTLALFYQTIITTQDGLTVIDQMVSTTTNDVESLQTTSQAMGKSIRDSSQMLNSLSILTSNDFPAAIKATKQSLASAQSSALLIDNAMTTLTSIPFISLPAYNPGVPLHTALAQVSTSLDSISPAFDAITANLIDSKSNMDAVEIELNKIAGTTKEIGRTLDSAQIVIGQYKTVTSQLKVRVSAAQQVASDWIYTIACILSFVLGCSMVSQLSMCMYGLDMLRDQHMAKPSDIAPRAS
jgi:hypothetical protein